MVIILVFTGLAQAALEKLEDSKKDVVFKTDFDPEGNFDQYINRDQGPIKSRIFTYVDKDAVENVRLVMRVYDIDEKGYPAGTIVYEGGSEGESSNPIGQGYPAEIRCKVEVDDVYINGNKIGTLTGAEGQWSIVSFKIPKELVKWMGDTEYGVNEIKVDIDTLNTGCWKTQVDWAEIRAEQRPLIFVPGILGTEMYSSGELEWINPYKLNHQLGKITDLSLAYNGNDPLNPSWNIHPGKIIREVVTADIYGKFIDFLRNKGYYSEITIHEQRDNIGRLRLRVTPLLDRNIRFYEFPYDWRKDLTQTANRLSDKVKTVKRETGYDQVFLVAHSMGGLVSRKFIKSGGDSDVKMLFTMGTPYYGAAKAYNILKVGEDLSGKGLTDPESVRQVTQNIPAVYQLLPTEKYEKAVITPVLDNYYDPFAEYLDINRAYLTDPQAKLRNPDLVQKALDFHSSLGNDFGNVKDVCILIGKDQPTTKIQIVIDGSFGHPPVYRVRTGNGDGTVPYGSAYAEFESGITDSCRSQVTGEHGDLPGNKIVQKYLWDKIIDRVTNDPTLTLTGFTDYGLDQDNDGLYDYLEVRFNATAYTTGNYTIGAQLNETQTANKSIISIAFNDSHFNAGETKELSLSFRGDQIYESNNSGRYSVKTQQFYNGLDQNAINYSIYTTSSYMPSQFEPSIYFGAGPVTLINASDSGIDTDGDGLYNYLQVAVTFNITTSGTYRFLSWISDSVSNNTVSIEGNELFLSSGVNTIAFNFSGSDIHKAGLDTSYNVSYNFDFNRQDNYTEVDNASSTAFYDYMQFNPVPATLSGNYTDQGIDTNNNGLYDYLIINVTVNVTQPGDYILQGSLLANKINETSLIATSMSVSLPLSPGIHDLQLKFPGERIFLSGINGPYLLGDVNLLNNASGTVDYAFQPYNTVSYNYTNFEPSPILFTGNFSETTFDTNNNGQYDILRIGVEIQSKTSGYHNYNARMTDENGSEIQWSKGSKYIQKNTPTFVDLDFSGPKIFADGKNGPYLIRDFSIYNDNDMLSSDTLNTTAPYKNTDFEHAGGQVRGRVRYANGMGIPGQIVAVIGETFTTTDSEGNYTISVSNTDTYNVICCNFFNADDWWVFVNGTKITNSTSILVNVGPDATNIVDFVDFTLTNLTTTAYSQTYINWTWNNTDFANVGIWIDGIFRTNVPEGVKFYNATGLDPDTLHTIATRTVDIYGNFDRIWVNHTARTAPLIGNWGWDSETQSFLSQINNYRAQNSLGALSTDVLLQAVANWMSEDMLSTCVATDSCSPAHFDSTGRSLRKRVNDFGYFYSAGENIGWGHGGGTTTALQAFEGWRNSPPHNADMLNYNWTAIGIARVCNGGECAWVTDFGTRVVETFEPAPLPPPVRVPDLVITAFSANPTTNMTVQVNITVTNQGGVETGANFQVNLFADPASPPTTADTPLVMVEVTPLNPSGSANIMISLPAGTLSAGTHTLWTLADGRGVIAELDESNNAANINITLGAANTPPVAANDSYSINEDSTLAVAVPGVLGNDTDIDGNPLTAAQVSAPSHGTLSLNANGSFIYIPIHYFSGEDSFIYKANDGKNDSNIATVSITVNPINDAPIAANDIYNIGQDAILSVPAPGILSNDADVDGDSVTANLINAPSSGNLLLNSNGSFTYIPDPGFHGTDIFTYNASDGQTNSNIANVTITVVAPPIVILGKPGDLLSWGTNDYGQLGDGTFNDRFAIGSASNMSGVVAVAAGGDDYGGFSLALKSDGTVWAWGRNYNGELGDGTYHERSRPVPVGGLTRIVAIAAGGSHSLALDANGSVWAWGNGGYGQLGDGTNNYRNSPVRVSGLTNVIAIAAGGYHSLALMSDGSVSAWGYNYYGQLGNDTITTNQNNPVQVLGGNGVGTLGGVVAIAGGNQQSIALKTDGTVWTWGENRYGELGVGRTDYFSTAYPVQVIGPDGIGFLQKVVAIASRKQHTLALTSDKTVLGWGYNSDSELGATTTAMCNPSYRLPCSPLPMRVQDLTNVTAVATGGYHSLALKDDGTLWGWGANYDGQLGVDPSLLEIRNRPATISNLSRVIAISAGYEHNLVVQQPLNQPQPPLNDNFSSASLLSMHASARGDTWMATTESVEPVPAVCGAIGKTVWYKIIPDTSGILIASTAGSTFDTRLALYTGSELSGLIAVNCDDNSGLEGTSLLTADVIAGKSYYLQVGGASFFPGTAHAGSFILQVSAGGRPGNDNFTDTSLLSFPSSLTGNTVPATVETGEQLYNCEETGHTVWYKLISDKAGILVASARSGEFQPVLALYTGSVVDALALEQCGRQLSVQELNGQPPTSRVTIPVEAGQTYYLQLGGTGGGGGIFTLETSLYPYPANDNFINASQLNLPGSTTGTTFGSTTQDFEPTKFNSDGLHIENTVWYLFVPEVTGELLIGVQSNFTPLISLYNGMSLDTLIRLSYQDINSPEVVPSLGFVEAGQTYYLQVGRDGNDGSIGGDFILHAAIGLTPDIAITDISAKGGPADEPLQVNITVSNRGNAATSTNFDVNFFSSTSRIPSSQNNPLLAIQVDSLDAGASVNLNVNLPPDAFDPGRRSLNAYADALDVIRESNEVNNLNSTTLTVDMPSVLERDNFSQANLLNLPGSFTGSTSHATTEHFEPLSCGNKKMGKTIWFKIIPDASGSLIATTNGSDFDTILSIYTGSSLGYLQQLGCNDDAGGSTRTSRLFNMVEGGQTYYIQLGGYNGESGQFKLQVTLDTSGLPDLVVTSLTADPANADQPVPVHFTISNYGSGIASRASQLHLFTDLPSPPTTSTIPLLIVNNITVPSPGDSIAMSAILPSGSLTAGEHILWALVDENDLIQESNEGNNAASIPVPISAPPPTPTIPDFTLTVSPSTLGLVPASSNSFVISLASVLGFSEAVNLSAEGLPNGVTASFFPATVTPSGTSILVLTASNDAATGSFPLTITGTSGGINHTTSGVIALNFGLVPICYGTFSGVVTDRETGLPVAGLNVKTPDNGNVTNENGRYSFKVPLGLNNAPAKYSLLATPQPNSTFFAGSASGTAICGVTTSIDLQVLRKKNGTVSGVVQGKDFTSGQIFPLVGATVLLNSSRAAITGEDGAYRSGPLQLNPDNAQANYSVDVFADGYWNVWDHVIVQADKDTKLNATLLAQCTGNISGKARFSDTFEPAANLTVRAFQSFNEYAGTDEAGNFLFPSVLLGYNNSIGTYRLTTSALHNFTLYSGFASATLSDCGDGVNVNLVLYPPEPSVPLIYWANVQGHVYDQETGLPLTGARVVAFGVGQEGNTDAFTDANGYYLLHVNTFNDNTTVFISLNAGIEGYWSSSGSLTVTHQWYTHDFSLLRNRYGAIAGTIRDVATREPVGNAIVELPGTVPTSSDGAYLSGKLSLGGDNTPISLNFQTSASGYWPKISQATLTGDQTTTVDVDLIKVCQGAAIVGKVVNAASLAPIEDATVSVGSKFTTTDKDGLFRLQDLTVGNDNSPTQVTVTVSASGFYPQSKTVAIFCGATITLDFGKPQTSLANIIGTVTSSSNGRPLAGVFIGSQFGVSAISDQAGNYRLNNAPLGPDNADRVWQVTAIHPDAPIQNKSVTVKASQDVRQDFQFDVLTNNLPPVAIDKSLMTKKDTPLNVSLNASDPDGDALIFSLKTLPANGTITGMAPNLVYTPDGGFIGNNSFTFSVNDGASDSNVATVEIIVALPNTVPVAENDTYSIYEDNTLNVDAPGVLSNDTDEDGDALKAILVSEPAHGTLMLNSNGSFNYIPNTNYKGLDSFIYEANDSRLDSNIATVSITVEESSTPPPPVPELSPLILTLAGITGLLLLSKKRLD